MDNKFDADIIKDAQDVSADDLSVVSGGLEVQPITLTSDQEGQKCSNEKKGPGPRRQRRT